MDEIVTPAHLTHRLEGSTAIAVQSVCWMRPVDHDLLVMDAAAYAIAKDALRHNGTASEARISKMDACMRLIPKNAHFNMTAGITAAINDMKLGIM